MDGRFAPAELAQEHFGSAELGDARRTRRLVKTAELVMGRPSGTLPQKLRGWNELVGLYRLAGRPEVTHPAVLEPHRRRVASAMRREPGPVLPVHDWTELDYTTRTSLKCLGQIGKGGGRGYICHNTLAVTPGRRVLGLAGQVLHRRRRVPAGERPKATREHPQRESRLWRRGCEAVGAAPAGSLWVDVCDRGADLYEFLAYEARHGRHFVVRAAKDRNLDGPDHVGSDRVHLKLFAYARDLPDLGRREVRVAAPGLPGGERRAVVRVAAGDADVSRPRVKSGDYDPRRQPSLRLRAIHVKEVDPPAGVDALEWTLLTDLPADTFAAAGEKVDWYACRPVVEELHKAMKTGCGIENPRFESEARLEPVIALLSVVAALLLQLRQLAKDAEADRTPATAVVPRLYARVLAGPRRGGGPPDMTVRQFFLALARLGGHPGRAADGWPGWLTLWRGWAELQSMVRGVLAVRNE